MFPTWKGQIEGKSVDDIVSLHVERWDKWEEYIDRLKVKGFVELTPPDNDKWAVRNWTEIKADVQGTELEFVKKLEAKRRNVLTDKYELDMQTAWAKRKLSRGSDTVLLDASFGSLNTTSDLDINVVSTTPEVMEVWMEFTRAFVASSSAQSFCEFWDSNFYYEPGVDYVSIPKRLMADKFPWTTPSTALYELQCVDVYTRAYETTSDIEIEGRRATPNPVQMTMEKEQRCYASSLYFAEKFREAYASYLEGGEREDVRIAYLNYAVTKIEGLVSVTSLAICMVFGKEVFQQYVNKKDMYLEPYMCGIAAYEMLRNLQMHSHDGLYKSKYANRLMYVLVNTPGLCDGHGRVLRWDKVAKIDKTNTAGLTVISRAIGFLLDFMDGEDEYEGGCEFLSEASRAKWERNLGDSLALLCKKTKAYVEGRIKLDTGKDEEREGREYAKNLIGGPEPSGSVSGV